MDGLAQVKKSMFHVIEPGDLESGEDREHILRIMFNHPERAFYYFAPKDRGMDDGIEMLRGSISFDVIDACYYAHPNFPNDYIQVLPGKAKFDWERDLVKDGCEFLRFTLTVTETQRRRMTAVEALSIAKALTAEPPLVELNPRLGWLTFNGKQIVNCLSQLWKRLRRRRYL